MALDLWFRGHEFKSRSGQDFFHFEILAFRSFQLVLAHANEINPDIYVHLASFLIQMKVQEKKYGYRLQCHIPNHLSFKGNLYPNINIYTNGQKKGYIIVYNIIF